MRERTCLRCGWVHFAVSRAHAEDEVASFNRFFDAADVETKAAFGNRHSSMKSYEHCMLCGAPHTEFRDSKPGDCPEGCTLNPILFEELC